MNLTLLHFPLFTLHCSDVPIICHEERGVARIPLFNLHKLADRADALPHLKLAPHVAVGQDQGEEVV